MHLSIGISCRHDRKAEFFSFEKNAVPRTKKFRHTVIYALDHRDFMQTSRRPPRSAIFGKKAWRFDGDGHLIAVCRILDVFDELCESTNGKNSAFQYIIVYTSAPFYCTQQCKTIPSMRTMHVQTALLTVPHKVHTLTTHTMCACVHAAEQVQ